MYFHKAQEKPSRWGSFADVQYAIRVNSEKIYNCDPDDDVLVMPLFWGLPALDYSGYNNHGTNHGATYKDGSLDFDGDDDYVDMGDVVSAPAQLTLSAWIKTSSTGAYLPIINKGIGISGNREYWLAITSGDVLSVVIADESAGDVDSISGTTNLTDNSFHHIAGTWDGSTLRAYVNGIEDNTQVSTSVTEIKDLSANLYIGRDVATTTRYFNGPIDEVRITKATRTADQIALFNDNKYGLYQKVNRPIYSIPAVGLSIPIAQYHYQQQRM